MASPPLAADPLDASPGLALYAIGSSRTAAFLSGINGRLTRIFAYALGGAFAAMAGSR